MVFMAKPREYQPPYPVAFRRDAVELVRLSGRPIRELASELGVSYESLRLWCKQSEIDAGNRDGLSSEEREELRRLRRRVKVLEEEREILKKAAAFLDRKSTRLNSSHQIISYAVFCLKKKKEG